MGLRYFWFENCNCSVVQDAALPAVRYCVGCSVPPSYSRALEFKLEHFAGFCSNPAPFFRALTFLASPCPSDHLLPLSRAADALLCANSKLVEWAQQ